ncbi:MAG: hypothetical protein K0Q79_3387 [Flavipsychrobacter sp.]|jgi:hypothetical protein|nr:hypothetical protein [Flavipsychrobacter sp.]
MVGEGVLTECLQHPDVEQVLAINRRQCGVRHPKLKEILHGDFHNLSPVKTELTGYDACFFCAGVTSIGKKEPEYYHLTYDLTIHFAETVAAQNPGMVFCYVSGAGTDSTEKGRSMWARVKGKTENRLMQLPFKRAYMFRPGMMKPNKGAKNVLKGYWVVGWLYPVFKALGLACELKDVGTAMIHSVTKGCDKQILEIRDIVALARK